MSRQLKVQPEIGHWYDSKDVPECFVVIDADIDDFIEIQYQDGELDKIDFDTWAAIHPEEISEPEDASAPYEMEQEDILDLLNDIESHSESLDDHLRHLDDMDDSFWR